MISTGIRFAVVVMTGVVCYCLGVYAAIEANHSQQVEGLIKTISIIKRFLE